MLKEEQNDKGSLQNLVRKVVQVLVLYKTIAMENAIFP